MPNVVEPICKMEVDTSSPPGGQTDYQGTSYYFCAPGCKIAFDQDPEKYLAENWEGLNMEPEKKKAGFFSRLFGRGS